MAHEKDRGPLDPPRHCPTCGQDPSDYPYYQRGLSRPAKLLRRVALGLLPIFAALYLALIFWGTTPPPFGAGAAYYAAIWVGGPSLILYALSRLFPRTRIVICQRCSWNKEYPPSRQLPSEDERKAA
jgi:amino acid transporter